MENINDSLIEFFRVNHNNIYAPYVMANVTFDIIPQTNFKIFDMYIIEITDILEENPFDRLDSRMEWSKWL